MPQCRWDGLRRGSPAREFFEGGRAYTSFRRAPCRATDLIAMAIYHLHVKVIGRKSGSSAVASAAYRSGSRLRDERLDRSHDFSAKRGVDHSEVMLPENAPEAWSDRERLPTPARWSPLRILGRADSPTLELSP